MMKVLFLWGQMHSSSNKSMHDTSNAINNEGALRYDGETDDRTHTLGKRVQILKRKTQGKREAQTEMTIDDKYSALTACVKVSRTIPHWSCTYNINQRQRIKTTLDLNSDNRRHYSDRKQTISVDKWNVKIKAIFEEKYILFIIIFFFLKSITNDSKEKTKELSFWLVG